MADLATLAMVIDSRQVKEGVGELDKLTAAGGKAEKAIDRLGDEAKQSGSQIKTASQQASDYAANAQRMAANSTLAGSNIGSLGKATALAKVQTAALGNEVGNLAGSLATGNLSANEAARSIGRIGIASGITLAVIAPLVAAAGLLALAFVGIKNSAASDAEMKKFIGNLGLTKKEMEKLTDTAVTYGDVGKATFQILAEAAGTSSKEITDKFSSAFKSIGEFGKFSVAVIAAAFFAGFRGIARVVMALPGIVGDGMVGAVNLAIGGIEKMANQAVAGLNKLIAGANVILGVFGKRIDSIGEVHLERMANKFAGAGKEMSAAVKSDFFGAFNSVMGTFDAISQRATDIREAAIQSQADDIIADRTSKAAKAHKERAKAAKDESDALRKLAEERERLSRPADISNDLKRAGETPLNLDDGLNLNGLFGNISQETLLAPMNELLDTLNAITEQAFVTGEALSSAFGNAGNVIGNLITGIADYSAQRQALSIEVLKSNMKQETADKKLATLQARNVGMAIAGVKSLFKEKSTAFKVMQAVEMAYAAFQAANTIASMVRDSAKTASSVANSATRTAANTAEGGSKIFAELGPWAFPVVAAMVAVLAALGAKGGGGGSSGPKIPTAEDIQAGQGTGTVLGDAKAKSNSIANSLEIVAANTNRDLEYSNDMLRALRNIDLGIAKMAGTVARQIQVSGSLFDTSKLNIGSSGSGGFLGLFSSQTTKTLWDLGLNLQSASVAEIIANGIAGTTYQTVQKVKKKSGFLGIGGGTKTSYKTTTGTIDPEIIGAIQGVIASLRDGLVEASKVIGLQGAEAILNSFNVSLGKISFKDMTGEQIEDTLNAIFSRVGDEMAGAIIPSLTTLQKVGEGLFETFIRVAREYQVVDVSLKSIGKTFGMVGVASIAARDNLVQLFGGLDEFVEATNDFRDEFLSEAEQMAPVIASVKAEMARLGLASVDTRDEFKAMVLGLDLTTQSGRDMYAALLTVAPAFDKVLDYYEEANKKTADALQDTADKFNGFAASLRKYRDSLFATDSAQGNSLAALRAKFISTATLAATGDAGALGGLEGAGKDFLTVAKANASSLLQYQRDVALVAQGVDKGIFAAESVADYAELQLAALQSSVSILNAIATNTAATAVALGVQTLPTPVGTPVPVQAPQQAPAEIVQATADNKAALEAIASLLASMDRRFNRWDDGDALVIGTRDGDPIDVNLESWG